MFESGIYKIENKITGEIYIGQAIDLIARKRKHFPPRKDEDSYLHRAMNKYGVNNFSWEVIERVPYDDLNDREQYWIRYYHSYVKDPDYIKGYNLTPGGQNTVAEIRKIPIRQYDLQGKFIKEYNSIAEAAKENNINSSNIIEVCKGKRSHAGKYQWRYINEEKIIKDISKDIRQNKIPILQYDLKGNFIQKFSSLDEVVEKTNFDKSGICQSLKSKNKTAYNFQWKYENDQIKIIKSISKRVLKIDKNTGKILEEYENASIAAKKNKINRGNLGECLNNKRKSAGGFIWKYC